MKIKQLIEILNGCNQESEVMLNDFGFPFRATEVEERTLLIRRDEAGNYIQQEIGKEGYDMKNTKSETVYIIKQEK